MTAELLPKGMQDPQCLPKLMTGKDPEISIHKRMSGKDPKITQNQTPVWTFVKYTAEI